MTYALVWLSFVAFACSIGMWLYIGFVFAQRRRERRVLSVEDHAAAMAALDHVRSLAGITTTHACEAAGVLGSGQGALLAQSRTGEELRARTSVAPVGA